MRESVEKKKRKENGKFRNKEEEDYHMIKNSMRRMNSS